MKICSREVCPDESAPVEHDSVDAGREAELSALEAKLRSEEAAKTRALEKSLAESEAAAAAARAAEEAADDGYVYDEYLIDDSAPDTGGWAAPEVWWQEEGEEDELFLGGDADGLGDGDGSDSQGELDYPDESDGEGDAAGDDDYL